MEEVIASRKFVLEASPERVWSLMGRVIFSNLHGLERMQIIDESNFRALLRVRVAFISATMRLKGQILADSAHPESLGVLLKAKSVGGLIQLNQKITFTIMAVDEAKTEVTCEAIAQEMGFFFRMLFLGKVRSMAKSTLDGMEKRLKQIA